MEEEKQERAEGGEKECVICRSAEEEEDGDNVLVSPCDCKGTIAWRHQECLKEWIRVSKTLVCSECGAEYQTLPMVADVGSLQRWFASAKLVLEPEWKTLGMLVGSLALEVLDPILEEMISPYVSKAFHFVVSRSPAGFARVLEFGKDTFLFVTQSAVWELGWGGVALFDAYQSVKNAPHQWRILGSEIPNAVVVLNPMFPLIVDVVGRERWLKRTLYVQMGCSALLVLKGLPGCWRRFQKEMERHPWKVDVNRIEFVNKEE